MDKQFIEIKKSDVLMFLRLCDGLSKQAYSDHAKCALVRSISPNQVELFYYNNPNAVRVVCENGTSTMLQGFILQLKVLKELCSVADGDYMSFTFKNYHPYIVSSGRELYIETENLGTECYDATFIECNETLDLIKYEPLKKASPLTLKSTTSYQNLIVKNGCAFFNTSYFILKSDSPFSGSEDLLVPRPLVVTLNTLSDCGIEVMKYGLDAKTMTLTNGNITIVSQLCIGDMVNNYITDTVLYLVGFEGGIDVCDGLPLLLSSIGTLSYMEDIVTCSMNPTMLNVTTTNISHTTTDTYAFPIEGNESSCSDIKIPSSMLLSFIRMGEESKDGYKMTMNDKGVGLDLKTCKALLRRLG